MRGELQKDLAKIMNGLDHIILGIKAKGGYKERKRFQMSDRELDLFLADCERRLRMMVISLVMLCSGETEPEQQIQNGENFEECGAVHI